MYCFCTKIRTHHCKVVLLDEQELIQEIQVSHSPLVYLSYICVSSFPVSWISEEGMVWLIKYEVYVCHKKVSTVYSIPRWVWLRVKFNYWLGSCDRRKTILEILNNSPAFYFSSDEAPKPWQVVFIARKTKFHFSINVVCSWHRCMYPVK